MEDQPVSGCDVRVRDHVVCPVCRGPLDDAAQALACERCGVAYPVRDGVPWLVAEAALRWRREPERR